MPLDQFYTKPSIAQECYTFLRSTFPALGIKDPFFVEPSAGSGNFYGLLPAGKRIGLDIAPKGKGIRKQDFLLWRFPKRKAGDVVTVGNPPFGKRAKLAVEFFNRAALFSDTIGFIVPVQFRKYSVQSKLDRSFKLVAEKPLRENSFVTENGKEFHVNCVFQIWTKKATKLRNKRILTPPPIRHNDFEMYQYNNTKEALKVFQYEFDFGVPRQGYENYRRRETDAGRMEKNKQWILFKAYNEEVRKRLFDLDFEKLATKNTVVPGFGKADVVEEYLRITKRHA